MSECNQTQSQTILEHGESVSLHYKDLIGERKLEWRLPTWFDLNFLLPLCPSPEVMEQYHIYHDCGKPFCISRDENGKQHFPDHARISAAIWAAYGGDDMIGKYILHDMDMHIMKPSEADSYKHMDLAPALLLTALAELHANASMFGGIESTSFKIKFKNLQKLGNNLINIIKGN
jgi:hypothetical protein